MNKINTAILEQERAKADKRIVEIRQYVANYAKETEYNQTLIRAIDEAISPPTKKP